MGFYENFLRLCNGVGKTPSKVAEETGISKSIISRWKTGGGVTDATAMKIANYFSVPITALLQDSAWEAFGSSLSYRLDCEDLTPLEFAQKMGYDISSVNAWLRSEEYPRIETIDEIAKFFDLDVSNLTEATGVYLQPEDYFKHSRPANIDDTTFSIMCRASFLSQENKEIILKLINSLSKDD